MEGESEGEGVMVELGGTSGEERLGGEQGVQGREGCFIADRKGGRGM